MKAAEIISAFANVHATLVVQCAWYAVSVPVIQGMPHVYKRTNGEPLRGLWTDETLSVAIRRYKASDIGLTEAARYYGVPARPLVRRIASGKNLKRGLGPEGRYICLNFVRPTEKLGLKNKFSHITKMAGYAWISSLLERNREITVRQAEGLSLAREQGVSRLELLELIRMEENLMDKPQNIFNMNESGIQLTNKPGKLVTTKGAKDVHVLTPHERGENVTVIACCDAEGAFLPPVLLMKGVNRKNEFSDGLPHGSEVYTNPKSSFKTADLFLKWFEKHFLPRKSPGKNILILDGHTSHYNAFEMLNLAEKNRMITLCLPSRTTQALQLLDCSFFGPFKGYYNNEAKVWLQHHKFRNITRYQAGYHIGNAWNKAASVGNAVAGFKATGIFPLYPDIVPEHFLCNI
ncbi:hypothetical protein PR048_032541 [Dryococelus australis]|uniref:DDE-1 domain-containing protein n=1 Tax=Dryococelus australis TaxID=614101 RepID=A0ABQ9G2H4_9NEOP|nr:hypothetical protein PR048_032541 [Dryococelus australis]